MNPLTVHRWAYEWTGGRIGHRLPGGVRAALLQTTGWNTGLARTAPLACFRDGADYVFVAAQEELRCKQRWSTPCPHDAGS
jgi:F420H(2)-dependent quinone reductase